MSLMTEVDVAYGAIVFVKQLNGERERFFLLFNYFCRKILVSFFCVQSVGRGVLVSPSRPMSHIRGCFGLSNFRRFQLVCVMA